MGQFAHICPQGRQVGLGGEGSSVQRAADACKLRALCGPLEPSGAQRAACRNCAQGYGGPTGQPVCTPRCAASRCTTGCDPHRRVVVGRDGRGLGGRLERPTSSPLARAGRTRSGQVRPTATTVAAGAGANRRGGSIPFFLPLCYAALHDHLDEGLGEVLLELSQQRLHLVAHVILGARGRQAKHLNLRSSTWFGCSSPCGPARALPPHRSLGQDAPALSQSRPPGSRPDARGATDRGERLRRSRQGPQRQMHRVCWSPQTSLW